MIYKEISSVQNPTIKSLMLLEQKSAQRKQTGLFVVEGLREVQRAIAAGLSIESVFWCDDICPMLPKLAPETNVYKVSYPVYNKIAYREGTEGIIAQVRSKDLCLQDLDLDHNPVIIVLESVEKPGNLGAVLRSADAAGIDAVIVCDPLTDLTNPNLIRASLGAFFSVPTVACTSEQAIECFRSKGIQILTAQLQDSQLYYDQDMKKPTAIVMGTESTGLTQIWRDAATAHIRIPMLGAMDSLNVSVSAAILMYEALRQRSL